MRKSVEVQEEDGCLRLRRRRLRRELGGRRKSVAIYGQRRECGISIGTRK